MNISTITDAWNVHAAAPAMVSHGKDAQLICSSLIIGAYNVFEVIHATDRKQHRAAVQIMSTITCV